MTIGRMLLVLWLTLQLLLSAMYCPDDKMKINRFKSVKIPRNCEYVRRFGKMTPMESQYTGDQLAPRSGNKVDMLYQAELMDLQDQRSESADGDGA